jgi:RNA polymerase sigma-70 factor (ECF subfamily)
MRVIPALAFAWRLGHNHFHKKRYRTGRSLPFDVSVYGASMAESDAPDLWHPERYRDYLLMLARLRLNPWLHGKLSASDVVQETLLREEQHKDQFRRDAHALAAYLRQILANTLADQMRAFARGKRDIALERSLHEALERSSIHLEQWLAAEQSSPSEQAERNELLLRLADALAALPEDERVALELRYLQEPVAPLADIATHLGRPSVKSVAGLLARGLERLRKRLQA